MTRAVLLLALAAVAAAAPAEKRIRTALHAILAEPDDAERRKLIEGLGDGQGSIDEVESILRKGPLDPRDAAEGKGVERIGGFGA